MPSRRPSWRIFAEGSAKLICIKYHARLLRGRVVNTTLFKRIDVYDRLFVGMCRADSRDDFRKEFVYDGDFYPFLFHFFEFSDLADSGMRAFLRLESPDTPHAETTKRIVALFSSSRLPHRLSHFHRAFYRHHHNNLFHS